MEQTPIQRAVSLAGSQSMLAARLKQIGQSAVSQMATGERPVPLDRAVEIEYVLGANVTCDELRTDVVWHRVPDARWPHAQGRPLLDMALPLLVEVA